MDTSKIKNLGFRKDFSNVKEFIRDDYYRYRKFGETEHYIMWRVDRDVPEWRSAWDKFELWKKAYVKNPDGTKVVRKLNDEDGGKFYWFFNSFDDFKWYLKKYPKKFPEEVSEFCQG